MKFSVRVIVVLLRLTSSYYWGWAHGNMCWTDECVRTSLNIMDSMNSTANACDDFYEHACGNWIGNTVLPAGANSWGHVQILRRNVIENLHGLLEESSADTYMERKTKMLYRACMDTDAMDRDGITVLKDIIDESSGWPLIESDHESTDVLTPWENIHAYYSRLTGIGGLINVHIITTSGLIISVNQPVTIYGKYRLQDAGDKADSYKQFIKDVASIFIESTMSEVTMASVEKDVDDVIKFRSRLQEILDRRLQADAADDLNTIQTLQNFSDNVAGQLTSIDWLTLIKECFPHEIRDTINSDEGIFVNEERYVKRLIPLLKSTPPRTIINHIQLYFVERHLQYTDSRMRALVLDLANKIEGLQQNEERWEACVKSNQMKHVLSSMYVKKYFPRTSKIDLMSMTEDLRSILAKHINESTWLDESTKREALLKVQRMRAQIGYEDWYEDRTKLQDYYKGQDVGTNYLRNVLSYSRNEYKIELQKLRRIKTRESSDSYPTDVNAYYDRTTNSIIIHAAYLQWPIYTKGVPEMVNYATVGSLIAHEMGHAFDTIGRKYNSVGEYVNWWSDQSNEVYDNKTTCITEMYDNYYAPEVEPNLKMDNGYTTLDENIADIIGLRVAYDTFQEVIHTRPSGCWKTLPRLNWISLDKSFFFAYASSLCEVVNPDEIETMMWVNNHNFARFRVDGPIALMPEFEHTFSCSPNSRMSPQERCTFWDT